MVRATQTFSGDLYKVPAEATHSSTSVAVIQPNDIMLWLSNPQDFSSTLIKIPLILSCTTLTVLAQTPPPTPQPTREESEKYGKKADMMGSHWTLKRSGYLYKVRQFIII